MLWYPRSCTSSSKPSSKYTLQAIGQLREQWGDCNLFEGLRRRKGQERILGIPRSFVIQVIGNLWYQNDYSYEWLSQPTYKFVVVWFCCTEVRSGRVSRSRRFDKMTSWLMKEWCMLNLSHLVPTLLLPKNCALTLHSANQTNKAAPWRRHRLPPGSKRVVQKIYNFQIV